jgi:hypothetical protein
MIALCQCPFIAVSMVLYRSIGGQQCMLAFPSLFSGLVATS